MSTYTSLELTLHNSKNWRFIIFFLLFSASSIGFLHINSFPLEPHDIYVIITAQGMHQHHDWIVPYFYDQLRLNKPPMNYWIAGLAAWFTNSFDHMQPWHGRLTSVLSGIGLLSLLLYLGERLYDRKTAVIGAVILITSMGFYKFTHSARPDMLYAFFCTASYTVFFRAYENYKNQLPYRCLSISMWLLFAAATLTKGPHVPAMIIIACTLYMILQKCSYREIIKLLKPVTGVILLMVLTIPWWILVKQSIGTEQLASSQLSGTLLTINWRNIFRFYYLYKVWIIIAPWVLLAPYMIYRVVRFDRREADTQFLFLLLIVAIVIFSFGPQSRWFYMLPFIVPICLLLASSLIKLWGTNPKSTGRANFNYLVIAHWAVLAIFLAWLLLTDFSIIPEVNSNNIWILLVLLVSTLIVSIILREYRKSYPWFDLMGVLVIISYILINFGATSLFWGKSRFDTFQLAQKTGKTLPDTIPLVAFETNPSVFHFYTGRPVTSFKTVNEIESFLVANGGKAALFIRSKKISKLAEGHFQIVGNCIVMDKPQRDTCVLLQMPITS